MKSRVSPWLTLLLAAPLVTVLVEVPGPALALECSRGLVIAAGDYHSVAAEEEPGTSSVWGEGTGNASLSTVPTPVGGLDGVRAVAAGDEHVLAVRDDGTVWAWGYNAHGQLGDGTTENRLSPVQVVGLTDITRVAAGWDFSLALSGDGTVWAWGDNELGTLGDGTWTDRTTPVQVTGLTNVVDIAAGMSHALAIRGTDGTAWAWGNGYSGQLGDGKTFTYGSPVQVKNLSGVVSIAGGTTHSGDGQGVVLGYSVAVRADGTVWAWGDNSDGQLGDGTTNNRLAPIQTTGLTGVSTVAAGSAYGFSVALKGDGTLWAWGDNSNGQIGDGATASRLTPVRVGTLNAVTDVAAGGRHVVARRQDGSLWAWGDNSSGQLGDGTLLDHAPPKQVLCTSAPSPSVSPSPVPSPSQVPSPSPSLPASPTPSASLPGAGEHTPVARCEPVRRGSGVVLTGVATAATHAPPALTTTILCELETPTQTYPVSQTAAGPVAVAVASIPTGMTQLFVCTSASATYPDGHVGTLNRSCAEIP